MSAKSIGFSNMWVNISENTTMGIRFYLLSAQLLLLLSWLMTASNHKRVFEEVWGLAPHFYHPVAWSAAPPKVDQQFWIGSVPQLGHYLHLAGCEDFRDTKVPRLFRCGVNRKHLQQSIVVIVILLYIETMTRISIPKFSDACRGLHALFRNVQEIGPRKLSFGVRGWGNDEL